MSLNITELARKSPALLRRLRHNLANEISEDVSLRFHLHTLVHLLIALTTITVHRTVLPQMVADFHNGSLSAHGEIALLYFGKFLGDIEPAIACAVVSILADFSLFVVEKKGALKQRFAEALRTVRVSIPPLLLALSVVLIVDVETYQVLVMQLYHALLPLVHNGGQLFREVVGTAQPLDTIAGLYGIVVAARIFTSYRATFRKKWEEKFAHQSSEATAGEGSEMGLLLLE